MVRLAELVEAAGALCLVVAAAHVDPALAWAAGGVGLVVKAFDLERRDR